MAKIEKIMTEQTTDLQAEIDEFYEAKEKEMNADQSPELLRRAYSREEITAKLNQWMIAEFGNPREIPNDMRAREWWYRDLGLIYHFICDHFPETITHETHPPTPQDPTQGPQEAGDQDPAQTNQQGQGETGQGVSGAERCCTTDRDMRLVRGG